MIAKKLAAFVPAVVVSCLVFASPSLAGFGFLSGSQGFDGQVLNQDGSPDTQAGSHPYSYTVDFSLNTKEDPLSGGTIPDGGQLKDIRVAVPPGVVGNPNAVPTCTQQQFFAINGGENSSCPDDTAVGFVKVVAFGGGFNQNLPVYSLRPSGGTPVLFGFSYANFRVTLTAFIRTGSDYGVTINTPNITQVLGVTGSSFTFWGVPADSGHNPFRGNCLDNGVQETGELKSLGNCGTDVRPTAFLTLPTSCTGPLTTRISADSWDNPGVFVEDSYVSHDNEGKPIGLDGCNHLDFNPSITVAPDSAAGSTPTGLTVGFHVPQEQILNPMGLVESDLRDTTVALPAGVQLSPSAADGLQACSLEQVGLESAGRSSCPDASKVGNVEIHTPLLPNPIVGAAYLAAQNANPFGSLVALYLVAEDPVSGVIVKIAGQVSPDPVTGQLISVFKDTPQLPFSELKLHFFGTARAPLSTPAYCGTYTTSTVLAPWSGSAPSTPSSSFAITSGPAGSPCPDPLPFVPSLTAGSTNIQAGAFSPFTLTMSREDGNQTLSTIGLRIPPGLLGMLSSVKLCKEPQASQGTCGPESLIGHTIVSVGMGDDPFSVTGGEVFITEGYKGAPYGLSIANPAKAGPFVLNEGKPVVVRAAINVDPHTAALTVTSDPLPTILDGIPLEIKHVNVTIDRPGFTFNPTNCEPLTIGASLASTEGSSKAVSVPFQVTNCATLAFKPNFKVSTSGHTSRANGASLIVKLAYPKASFGSQGNISRVKVDLPKQLPSRLTTLQKACSDSVFNANPAACPSASRVGRARAITPVLTNPLDGIAYFVSHGGAQFPDLIIVLQAEGLRVDLVGSTFISKKGITSSTFKTVPDVPIGSFELTLPQGPFSALAANGNLCKSKLKMPTAFTAQNGTEIHQSTPITVTGCAKHKAKKSHKATRRHKSKKK